MMELVVTCFLAGQLLFQVPSGWTVTEIYTGGEPSSLGNTLILTYCPPECVEERKKPWIVLKRTVEPGEIVKPPGKQCNLMVLKTQE